MNNALLHLPWSALLTVFLLAGCAASSPEIVYYSLYVPAAPAVQPATPAGGTLALSVGPVVLPDILRQAQIVTGGADGRYQRAEYHRWSGELDRDIARVVAEHLAAALGTEQVGVFPWDQQFTPTVRVLIDVLVMGGELGREAVLGARWAVIDPQGKRPAVMRRSDLREVPAGAGHADWVAAQRRNAARLGEEIAAVIGGATVP